MKKNIKIFLIYSFVATFFNFSFSQCEATDPVLFLGNDFLGNDQTICPSSSLILSAPSGYGFYNWSNNTHGKTISVNTSGTYSVEVGNISTKNLVINGEFEFENASFTSSYTLGSGLGTYMGVNYGPLISAGSYIVTDDPNKAHVNFPKYKDHTVSGTKMMVVNGSGSPNSMVWSQTIIVSPNSDYILGAWIMTAKSDPAVANLQFFINGVQIGSVFNANPTQDIWEQFTNTWNSGSSTTAVLSIYNQNTVNTGNDFAIDDITFKAVCKKTDEIIISVAAPTQTITTTPSTNCSGTNDGSISITSIAVNYSFDGGSTWGVINSKSGLAAGDYIVMSRNSGGCSVSQTVTLPSLVTSPTQTVTSINSTACFGSGNGSILINSPTAVDYSFDGGSSWGNSNSKLNMLPGTYTVLSRNSAGCTTSSTVNLTGNTIPITLTVSNDVTVCQNEIVNFTATAIGGNSFTYVWDDFTSTNSSQNFTPIQTKSYGVKAVNQDGCESVKSGILVTVLNPLSATASPDVSTCSNQSVKLSVSNINGGKSPYTVVWTNNMNPVGIGTSFTTNIQGTYVVVIRDACNTPAMIPLTINVSKSIGISPTFSIDNAKQCEPVIFRLTNTMDPSLIKSSVWKISNGDIIKNQNDVALNSLKNGSFDVKLLVETIDGCLDSINVLNALVVLPKPIANFLDSVTYGDASSVKLNLINLSVGANSYEWKIPVPIPEMSTQKDFSTSFINNNLSEFSVTLISKTDQNCTDSLTKIIKIKSGLYFFPPNSFTPNGDGINETWKVSVLGYSEKDFELSVFNRWGQIIWESNDSTEEWDGSYKSQKVPTGAYFWTIILKDSQTDKKYYNKGVLNLIR